MSVDRDNPFSADEVRALSERLAASDDAYASNVELLAAIRDGTLSFDQVDEEALRRCMETLGADAVIKAFLTAEAEVTPNESQPLGAGTAPVGVQSANKPWLKRAKEHSAVVGRNRNLTVWFGVVAAVVFVGVMIFKAATHKLILDQSVAGNPVKQVLPPAAVGNRTSTPVSQPQPAPAAEAVTKKPAKPPVGQVTQPELKSPAPGPPPTATVVGSIIIQPSPQPPAATQLAQEQKDKLDALGPQIDNLKARAAAVNKSLDSIQRRGLFAGYSMRGYLAAKQTSMNVNLSKADQAFKAQDPDRASRFAELAEPDLKALQAFLGLAPAIINTADIARLPQTERRRIAVMNLDVSPDTKAKAAQQLGVESDLGATFADLITTRLSSDGKFVPIERSALDRVIKEQNLSNSDRIDQATALKLAKLAGVDAIVIGTVTQYTGEVVTNTSKGFSLGRIPIPRSQSVTRTVSVGLTARLIDTSTGLILASAVGTGTAKQNQSNMAGTTTTGSAMFPAKLTNDATTQAITQVVQQIEAAPLPTPAENKPVAAPVVGLETPTRPQLSQAQRDKLDALGRQLDNLKARTAAVNNSLNTIQRQQGAGYGMRGDIAARQASMNLNLSKADEAFKAEDLDRASRFAAMTEADLRALETFLGQ